MTSTTLVLTPWYTPFHVISWQDAITLYFLDKVDVVASYAEEIRSPSTSIAMPAVVRLRRKVIVEQRRVRFSRKNVYLRDELTCSYCSTRLPFGQLTLDHVLPRSRGGTTTWENVLTACTPCNARKADMTPAEAGMRPRQAPRRPATLPLWPLHIDVGTAPHEWRDWLASARPAARA